MDYAYRLVKNVKGSLQFYLADNSFPFQYFYSTINSANVSGAIDVVVVEQPDGEYKSTPFHVRFGKYGVFNHLNKYVDIAVNGEEIDLKMKLMDSGVAFFVEEVDDAGIPEYLITSPLPEQKANSNTDQVLAESAKKLQEVAGSKAAELIQRRNTVPEDEPELGVGQEAGAGQGMSNHAEEQSLSQVARKRTLPFSSSVFSDRKYRSLPDLSSISESNCGHVSDTEGMALIAAVRKKTPPRKYSYFPNSKTAFPLSEKLSRKERADAFEEFRKNRRAYRKAKEEKELQKKKDADVEADDEAEENVERKKSKVTFDLTNPVNISVNDSDNESSSSLSSSPSPSPSAANDSTSLSKLDAERIAEGALSDSEIDKHRERNEPEPHDVTDWKWGEIPQTRSEENQRKQQEETQKQESNSSSYWWFWPRPSKPAKEEEKKQEGISLDQLISNAQSDPVAIEKYLGKASSATMSVDSGNASRGVSQPASPTSASGMAESPEKSPSDGITPLASPSSEKTPTLENVNLNDSQRLRAPQPGTGHSRVRSSSEQRSQSSDEIFPLSEDELLEDFIDETSQKRYVRSLRLSSAKLKSLQLVYGANECRFSITTRFQGTTWCSCNIYLYKWYEQIVISDIDGTITKSDVLGHVIPAIGGTWAHTGVAELYTRIKNNGYKMVYLSSRAIGQSHTTKQYLKSIAQDSKQLPDGPVLLSPTSILTAFRREVIERRPEEFKIAALNDLKQLFPHNPFYAGFGNRETDVKSYRAVDVPFSRILIIDPSGRVKRSDSVGYVGSYTIIANETVDYIFPPLVRITTKSEENNEEEQERLNLPWSKPLEHSDFTHWNSTCDAVIEPIIAVTDEELGKYEASRKTSITENLKKKK
ncbi:hypothetical protein WR25_01559 [Diploscapter pachys]|uniref:LNS2/PITP domain-containing protein n=1 Tax=Diploscapter pachys TaxID=2018661 RepID=A0A2A2K5F6_9BILA|nr:hypothetical protein WR25_01559 [Diploscapter pachys]